MFEARGVFFMNVNEKNVTFMPSIPKLVEKVCQKFSNDDLKFC